MSIKSEIPIIYASIGDREDVNVNPTRAHVVASVLKSEQADNYRRLMADGATADARNVYISKLELALLEALGEDFLADRIRELAKDPEVCRAPIWADILKLVANKLSPESM